MLPRVLFVFDADHLLLDNAAHPAATTPGSGDVNYVAAAIRVAQFYFGVTRSLVHLAWDVGGFMVRMLRRVVDPSFRRDLMDTWARFNPPGPERESSDPIVLH